MKSTNRNKIVIIHSLVFALFLSGCMSTSRHLTEVAEKDLIIQDKNMQNASLVELKDGLKDRLSKVNRQTIKNEQALREKRQADRAEINTLKEKLARMERIADLKNQKAQKAEIASQSLIKKLRGEIEAGNVMVSNGKDRLSVQIVNKVLFASGSNQVSQKGKEVLKNVSKALKEVEGSTIRVEGHTDNVPISPSLSEKFPSNWELSTARATQVVRYLIEEKVNPENLMAVGMSQYDPVVINDSPEGREMNRRIEIVLVPKDNF